MQLLKWVISLIVALAVVCAGVVLVGLAAMVVIIIKIVVLVSAMVAFIGYMIYEWMGHRPKTGQPPSQRK